MLSPVGCGFYLGEKPFRIFYNQGPVIPSLIKHNPGIVEILLVIYLQWKEDFSQARLRFKVKKFVIIYNLTGPRTILWQTLSLAVNKEKLLKLTRISLIELWKTGPRILSTNIILMIFIFWWTHTRSKIKIFTKLKVTSKAP